jgi:hypothetical protein
MPVGDLPERSAAEAALSAATTLRAAMPAGWCTAKNWDRTESHQRRLIAAVRLIVKRSDLDDPKYVGRLAAARLTSHLSEPAATAASARAAVV